jgi:predicted unusual protein kinase regulating ubiquinone biosynthesis (AarF/ABC1/UbiB family)
MEAHRDPDPDRDHDDVAADSLPTGKLTRATKAAGAVAPSSVRFFTTLATNVMRSPDDAAEMLLRRHEDIADNALAVLGELRGGALKIGQLASFVDVDLIPPEYRTLYQEKLADLRDSAPPMSWKKIRQVLEREWEEPVESLFEDFEHDAVAAASIGQVHRAVLPDGRRVAVKIQYPEIADALEADLGTAQGLTAIATPLAKAMMPGLDPRMLIGEVRELVLEELDYELEAQHQRRVQRLFRGHPFITVPRVHTDLSTRRVLVSDYVEGERFDAVSALDQGRRDRYGEIVFRFYFGLLYRHGIALGDPHPGNYLLRPDGRVAFLDYGLVRDVGPARLAAEKAIALAVRDQDPAALAAALVAGGYVSSAHTEGLDTELTLAITTAATRWYAVPGERRLSPERRGPRAAADPPDGEREAAFREQAGRFTLPPETMLIRRMHALVAIVLTRLRASADWGVIAAEYLHGEPPATPLGHLEAAFGGGAR